MASAECIPPTVHLDSTLGAAFIGDIISAALYGITTLQTYIYFDRCKDGLVLGSLVLFLWLLDTAHMVFMTHTVYFYAVTKYGNLAALVEVTWSIMALITATGLSDVIVRAIFAYRIWKIGGKKTAWLIVMIAIPSLLTFACSLSFTVRSTVLGTYSKFPEISYLLYIAFGSGVIADVLIAASLCILLLRRRTGFKQTDSIVRLLTIYSINTGAFTSLCAIVVLITYATMPNNFIFISVYFILPKLFLNSLLATLNAREKLRTHSARSDGVVSIPLTTNINSIGKGPSTRSDLSDETQPTVEIQVETTTDRKIDSISHIPRSAWPGTFGSSVRESSRYATFDKAV